MRNPSANTNRIQESPRDRRYPRHSLASTHAERTILGAILLENESFFEASQEISETDFYLDSTADLLRIADSCAADLRQTQHVVEELRETRDLEAVGGSGTYTNHRTSPRKISIAHGCGS